MLERLYYRIYLALILAAVLSGCAPSRSQHSILAPTGDSIVRSQTLVQEANVHVKAVQPHTSGADQDHLVTASTELTTADQQLTKARGELDQERKQCARLADENTKQATIIDAYTHRWIGDRTFSAIRWIIGIFIAIGIAGTVLSGFFGGGVLGTIGGQLLHLIPFSNPFAWAATAIRAKSTTG